MLRHATVGGSVLVVALALLASGCGASGSAADAGAPGGAGAAAPVLRVSAEATGSSCARGGWIVQIGLDSNRNGVLDDAEVTSTSHVCDPDDGARDAGTDASQDGADAAADSGTDAGTELLQPLLRVDPAPAGARCPNGGSVVRAGLDRNHDGTLDDSEVTSSSDVCNGGAATPSGVLEGSMTVRNALDVALLGLFSEVTGDVDLETVGLTAIALPNLTKIGGALTGNVTGATSLDFPALVSVQKVNIRGDALSTVKLEALTSAPGSLVIRPANGPATLTALSVPALRTVGGVELSVAGAGLSLPALSTAGTIDLAGAKSVDLPALTRAVSLAVTQVAGTVSAPLLDVDSLDAPMNVTITGVAAGAGSFNLHALRAGCVVLANAAAVDVSSLVRTGPSCAFSYAGVGLTSLALPALTQGSVTVLNASLYCGIGLGCSATLMPTTITDISAPLLVNGAIDVRYTTTLKTVSLPSLTMASLFRISNDPALIRIAAPKLASAKQLDVSNDGALPACQATGILAQIAPPPDTVDTSGNLTTGTCP